MAKLKIQKNIVELSAELVDKELLVNAANVADTDNKNGKPVITTNGVAVQGRCYWVGSVGICPPSFSKFRGKKSLKIAKFVHLVCS